MRDEVKNDVLRKNIIVNSKGYPDLIQKDFLNESLLEYSKGSVEKLNRALEKDLMKSAEGESDHNLYSNLMGEVAFRGK